MLKQGTYIAENNEGIFDQYKILLYAKETEKSYRFVLIDFQSRYSATQIEDLFRNSREVTIRKDRGGHAIRVWDNESFTFYPYQAGVPFYFKLRKEIDK